MIKRRELLVGSVGAAVATSVAAAAKVPGNSNVPPQSNDQEDLAAQQRHQVALLCLGRSALADRARRQSDADV